MTEYVRGGVAAEQTPQQRRTARIAGWLMLSTFVTSIGALILYQPAFDDGYILGGGDDGQITLAALLEIFLMIGNVGTAVVMFPILRRYSETLSLSYVTSRTIEAELAAYAVDLSYAGADGAVVPLNERPRLVALNKVDVPDGKDMAEFVRPELERRGYKVFEISAVSHEGLR